MDNDELYQVLLREDLDLFKCGGYFLAKVNKNAVTNVIT